MFGVGIHFSIRDLLAVRSIAIPGAIVQILVVTLLGIWLGSALGWGLGGGLVLGLAMSIASTVVLLRALDGPWRARHAQGRIAVGWLIVEDLLAVLVLVLLPTHRPAPGPVARPRPDRSTCSARSRFALALGKAAAFAVADDRRRCTRRAVAPPRRRPRGVSRAVHARGPRHRARASPTCPRRCSACRFALGAFLAGAVVGESDMSHQAAADALPLRDAFAVLFFVSVGMLLDPTFLWRTRCRSSPCVLLIVVAKAITTFAIVTVAGYPIRVGLTVAAGLAQIGEFSFILGTVGLLTRAAAGRGVPADRGRSAAVHHGQPVPVLAASTRSRHGCARRRPSRTCCSGGPGRSADLDEDDTAKACAARDHRRLRARRAADRAGPRASRLPLRRHHPATRRGRSPARSRRPGRLRRRDEPGGPARWPSSSTRG